MVRKLKTGKLGIQNPVGLAFSNNEQVFHVIESHGSFQSQSQNSDVIQITPRPTQIARTHIPTAITDPINIVFDDAYDRLLVLLPNTNVLMEVKAGPDGRLNPKTLDHHDARHFGLMDPQGMAVDPASGALLVLDNAASSIVRIAPTPDGSFDGGTVFRMDIQFLASTDLGGSLSIRVTVISTYWTTHVMSLMNSRLRGS